jgi:hypothetical protein
MTDTLFTTSLKAAGVDNISALAYNGILYGKVVAILIDFVIVAFVFAKKVMKEEVVAKN